MRPLIFLLIWVISSALFASPEACWKKALSKAISARLPQGTRVVIDHLRATQACTAKSRVEYLSPELPLGYVTFEVGTAQVKAFLPVAVAVQPLSHGESLSSENTRFEERELGRFSQNGYFVNLEQIQGRRVKGYLPAGQVVGRHNCQPASEVTQGQTVDLVKRKADLVLVAKVKALQAGLRNQWVQVQNPSSGKILLARITGPGEVEVR